VSAKQASVDFFWRGSIQGGADGTVRYEMDGKALKTFKRNRIGFCVLHPHSCAGKNCSIETTNGEKKASAFPVYVAPHQPFFDLEALNHEVAPGVVAEVRFEGETFETEDQRNWTDASFKTYCTPLDLPFPVEVRAGTRIQQAVTLSIQGTPPRSTYRRTDKAAEVSVDWQSAFPLPRIGLGLPRHGIAHTPAEVDRLRQISPAHLRVDLMLNEPAWRETLSMAVQDAAVLGAPLEMALHVSYNAQNELETLGDALKVLSSQNETPVLITRWLVFHVDEKCTTSPWVQLARLYLSEIIPEATFAAGTNAFFAELNRGQHPIDQVDALCYSINPQVHAFDDRSLVETIEAQAATVESARQLARGKAIAVSPVTLRMRFNPNATGPEPEPNPGELPLDVDRRQAECFTAAWTLGSLKHLAESGADSVTYYETTGWRGVMETEEGSPLPDQFRSVPGCVFPVFHLLADVGACSDAICHRLETSDPLAVTGLVLVKNGTSTLLMANLTGETQQVRLHLSGLSWATIRALDESNRTTAMTDPDSFRAAPDLSLAVDREMTELQLAPHAYLRLLLAR
jgi:hypothetical protein